MEKNQPLILYMVTSPWALRFFAGQPTAMREAGFRVGFVAPGGTELQRFGDNEGIETYAIPFEREISITSDLRCLWRLWRLVRSLRPAIVNVGTPKAGLLGGIAALLAGVPCRFYTLHGLKLETSSGIKRKLLTATEWIACRSAQKVICVSRTLRTEALELGVVDENKVVVLGNGTVNGVAAGNFIPTPAREREAAEIRNAFNIPGAALVVGFVGRFTRDKGIADLYAAFKQLQTSFSGLRLLLVGDFEDGDPVPSELRSAIEHDEFVIRTGFVDHPEPMYHVMDVLAFPSFREGFPGVPLEAQAAEVPVVTTDATGAIESVVDGTTGLVVKTGDSAALVNALHLLLNDPERRQRMGQAGRRWVGEVFRPRYVWDELIKEYRAGLRQAGIRTSVPPPPVEIVADLEA